MKKIYDRQAVFQESMKTKYDIMYLALTEEIGELVASFGYADWKKTTRDEDNIRIEAMDICIFAMNCHYYTKKKYVAPQGILSMVIDSDIQLIKAIQKLLVAGEYLEILPVIFSVYPEVKLKLIGKQALNTFRQDNGYKIGKYKKTWNGKEDNMTMLDFITANPKVTFEDIYTHLHEIYISL